MAALDVLTLDEAMDALKGIKGLGDQSRIAGLVTSVSKMLDQACGPVVQRAVTQSFTDKNTGPLFLQGKAVGAVTITEAFGSETPVSVASSDYVVDTDLVSVVSRWAGYWGSRVTVTYTAGRYATTEAVEEPFTTAAGILLQHHWRRSDGGGSETFGPPVGFLASGLPTFGFPQVVKDLLAGELLPPPIG